MSDMPTAIRIVLSATAVVSLLLSATASTSAQRPIPADSFPTPTRPVAAIVAPRWVDEEQRDALGEAERVLQALRIRPGMRVADIGAGDGYYVGHLATLLGPTGSVLAVDVEPRYLALLRERVRQAKWTNVRVISGEPHNPRLPDDGVDVALMIHMYHEIEQPFGLLFHLAFALKEDGLLGILDQEAPTTRHGTPTPLLRCEVEALGYEFVDRGVLADGAYLAIFRAPAAAARLTTAAAVRSRVAAARCRDR